MIRVTVQTQRDNLFRAAFHFTFCRIDSKILARIIPIPNTRADCDGGTELPNLWKYANAVHVTEQLQRPLAPPPVVIIIFASTCADEHIVVEMVPVQPAFAHVLKQQLHGMTHFSRLSAGLQHFAAWPVCPLQALLLHGMQELQASVPVPSLFAFMDGRHVHLCGKRACRLQLSQELHRFGHTATGRQAHDLSLELGNAGLVAWRFRILSRFTRVAWALLLAQGFFGGCLPRRAMWSSVGLVAVVQATEASDEAASKRV